MYDICWNETRNGNLKAKANEEQGCGWNSYIDENQNDKWIIYNEFHGNLFTADQNESQGQKFEFNLTSLYQRYQQLLQKIQSPRPFWEFNIQVKAHFGWLLLKRLLILNLKIQPNLIVLMPCWWTILAHLWLKPTTKHVLWYFKPNFSISLLEELF